MEKNKTGKPALPAGRYVKYAIGEIFLLVIGILIALSLNNWNDTLKERKQEQYILKKLVKELENDIEEIEIQITLGKLRQSEFRFCLEVLSNQKSSTREEFIKNFEGTITFISFDVNKTTFNSISESGNIAFINNKALADEINVFYNTNYKSWDDANKEYTRNVIGPYLMQFDHLPEYYTEQFSNWTPFTNNDFTTFDISKFEVSPRPLKDYKQNIFIINLLRRKLLLTEGQIKHYIGLKVEMEHLIAQISLEIE